MNESTSENHRSIATESADKIFSFFFSIFLQQGREAMHRHTAVGLCLQGRYVVIATDVSKQFQTKT